MSVEREGKDPYGLRSIRLALGKSQREMARLLAVSTRAVQSYEQGWRAMPEALQRLALFLLYLHNRDGYARDCRPCWLTLECPDETREACPAFVLRAPDFCWMIAADHCRATGNCTPKACSRCPAFPGQAAS